MSVRSLPALLCDVRLKYVAKYKRVVRLTGGSPDGLLIGEFLLIFVELCS